ncbi:hypothetical protein QJS66_00820 [Kocuria rhizophila]|nr:hypothetical protein QJS66_00820 [Kocuria rhizophila]
MRAQRALVGGDLGRGEGAVDHRHRAGRCEQSPGACAAVRGPGSAGARGVLGARQPADALQSPCRGAGRAARGRAAGAAHGAAAAATTRDSRAGTPGPAPPPTWTSPTAC